MRQGEKGFTLIEMLIALAIGSIVIGGIYSSIYQTYRLSTVSENSILVINQLENAGNLIRRDGMQATSVSFTANSLTLSWNYSTYGQGTHTIVYTRTGTNLTRKDNAGSPVVVARNITVFTVASGYSVTMTASTSGFAPVSRTLTYYFKPRLL